MSFKIQVRCKEQGVRPTLVQYMTEEFTKHMSDVLFFFRI